MYIKRNPFRSSKPTCSFHLCPSFIQQDAFSYYDVHFMNRTINAYTVAGSGFYSLFMAFSYVCVCLILIISFVPLFRTLRTADPLKEITVSLIISWSFLCSATYITYIILVRGVLIIVLFVLQIYFLLLQMEVR